jgi:hypothetical protein
VVLPQGYEHEDVAQVEQQQLLALESVLTSTRVQVPVYFAVQNDALQSLVSSQQHSFQMTQSTSLASTRC